FLPRFEENSRFLTAAYQAIGQVVRQGRTITPDAEWLIDNFYVVQEQLREIRQDLPRRYFLELPKLATGPLAGNPRVYALALELIAHTDSALDQEALLRFVHAYQEVAPLTIGEVWAVPIMLRLGMVENLRRLAAQMLHTQEERAHADRLAEGLLNRPPQQTPEGVLANFGHLCLSPACVVQAVERVRDHGQEAAVCVHWIEQRLEGRRIDDIIRIEHQRQAANQVSISNIITSMRLMSNLDWQVFFERTSLSEQVLRQDPAGIYKRMEFATRDMYRHRVEELSKRTRLPEVEVCSRLVEVARQADPTDSRRFHIGYYLIGKGQAQLEKVVGFRPRIHEGFQRRLVGHPTLVYLGSIFLVMALELAGLLWWVRAAGGSVWQLILAGVLALLPASELAVSLVNCLVTALMRPRVLPKMDFQTGVPQDYRTMVVIPTMLSSDEGVRHLLERLEIHYLANPEEGLAFALLTDFVDASEQHLPEDEHLVEQAVAGIRELNARYPAAEKERFFLFHRARRWNPAEAKWMGWERKRGKLLEFNRLLRGATDTGYVVQEGDWRRLGHIRFIITLDTDTQLPRGAARRLAGTLAHPLNEPRFDPQGCRVVEGYAVLQPRVTVSLASAHRSLFARIFSGAPGLDPYTTAVSDVYQDLFREGSFTGKGIYDVDTFEAATGATFPENHILSHDLIEGCHARVGLVSDVEFLDEFPAKYHAYARRQHRWVRGDWQLLPWLFRRVPTAGGVRPNPLTVLSRWKVLDNMRRSLVMPALLLLLAAGWLFLPGSAWVWT
ncbi:MAG: glycosyl transferase family 36, partial [Planctomycetes bacterium]|nr:glycosyl transferase family 36 [Planctomycetota bacterium]